MIDSLSISEHESVEWVFKRVPQETKKIVGKNVLISVTCFDVNLDIFVMGTSIGSAYIIRRVGNHMDTIIIKKNLSISYVKIIHTIDVTIAFGFENGSLSILNIPFKEFLIYSEVSLFHVPVEHKHSIMCLCWSKNAEKLFSGDSKGCICCTEVNYSEKMVSTFKVCELGHPVLQLGYGHKSLIVSTQLDSFIWDAEACSRRQIGSKIRTESSVVNEEDHSRGQGRFGISFTSKLCDKKQAEIIVVRPDSKVWISDVFGTVKRSILFNSKSIYASTKTISLLPSITSQTDNKVIKEIENSKIRYQLGNAIPLSDTVVLFWSKSGLVLCDITAGSILCSNCCLGRILNVSVCVFRPDSGSCSGSPVLVGLGRFSRTNPEPVRLCYEVWVHRQPIGPGDSRIVRLASVPLMTSKLSIDPLILIKPSPKVSSAPDSNRLPVKPKESTPNASIINEEFPILRDTGAQKGGSGGSGGSSLENSTNSQATVAADKVRHNVLGLTQMTKKIWRDGQEMVRSEMKRLENLETQEDGVEQALELTEDGLRVDFPELTNADDETKEKTLEPKPADNFVLMASLDAVDPTMEIDVKSLTDEHFVEGSSGQAISRQHRSAQSSSRNVRKINLLDLDDSAMDDAPEFSSQSMEEQPQRLTNEDIDVDRLTAHSVLERADQLLKKKHSETGDELEFPDLFSEIVSSYNQSGDADDLPTVGLHTDDCVDSDPISLEIDSTAIRQHREMVWDNSHFIERFDDTTERTSLMVPFCPASLTGLDDLVASSDDRESATIDLANEFSSMEDDTVTKAEDSLNNEENKTEIATELPFPDIDQEKEEPDQLVFHSSHFISRPIQTMDPSKEESVAERSSDSITATTSGSELDSMTDDILNASSRWICHRGPHLGQSGARLCSMSVNRRMVWLADSRGCLHVGLCPDAEETGSRPARRRPFHWLQETRLPADKIFSSSDGSIIYHEIAAASSGSNGGGDISVYTGMSRIWSSKVVKEKVLAKANWETMMTGICDVDIDQSMAVVVTKRGQLKVLDSISGRTPYKQAFTAKITGQVKLASCHEDVVWCVTEVDMASTSELSQHIFATYTQASRQQPMGARVAPDLSYWRMVPLPWELVMKRERDMGSLGGSQLLRAVSLGAGGLAWLTTTDQRAFFRRNVAPDMPSGEGPWFQISLHFLVDITSTMEYSIVKHGFEKVSTGFERLFGYSEADIRERKRGSISSQSSLLMSCKASPKGSMGNGLLWLSSAEKTSPSLLFESDKLILGHCWHDPLSADPQTGITVPTGRIVGLPALVAWRQVAISGSGSTPALWLIHQSGEIFCFWSRTKMRSVALPRSKGDVVLLAAHGTTVVIVTQTLRILLRSGVSIDNPFGSSWELVADFGKVPSHGEGVSQLVCREDKIWLVYKETLMLSSSVRYVGTDHASKCTWSHVSIKLHQDGNGSQRVASLCPAPPSVTPNSASSSPLPNWVWVTSEPDGRVYLGCLNQSELRFRWIFIPGPRAKSVQCSETNIWIVEQGAAGGGGSIFVRCGIDAAKPAGDRWLEVPCPWRPVSGLAVIGANRCLVAIDGCQGRLLWHRWALATEPIDGNTSVKENVDDSGRESKTSTKGDPEWELVD